MKTQFYYNIIWFYMFFEHICVFLCSVYCTHSQTEKSSVNKEDFDIKYDLI